MGKVSRKYMYLQGRNCVDTHPCPLCLPRPCTSSSYPQCVRCLDPGQFLLCHILSPEKPKLLCKGKIAYTCFLNMDINTVSALTFTAFLTWTPWVCVCGRGGGGGQAGDPGLGLMLCYCHLEVLNNFWTRVSAFSFHTEPANYEASPWCIYEGGGEGRSFHFIGPQSHSVLFHSLGKKYSLERQMSPCLPYHLDVQPPSDSI